MSPERKKNFSLRKNKFVNLLRNIFRIIFLIIFFHWIFWFTTYAKSTYYQESINEKDKNNNPVIDKHDKKTDKYNSRGLLSGEHEKKNIGEIEEDVLGQIEQKKDLNKGSLPRKWGEKENYTLDFKKLDEEIKELEKKDNPTKEEKEELEKKREEYKKKFEEAKEKTIENIQNQLKENKLSITELDDKRSLGQQITRDPLKMIIISPLNKLSKSFGLHSIRLWEVILEIIIKLLIIEIILVWISYSETIIVWENMEKTRDPYLSVEEKEQLAAEASPLVKYMFFNLFMMILFNFFLFFHPAFFDRTTPWFQAGGPGTGWYIWAFPLFISMLLSNVSSEFLRHGRLLNKKEWKKSLAKSWVVSLVFALGLVLVMYSFRANSIGNYLFTTLGGLVRFAINAIRAKYFGHREYYSPQKGKTYR
ncbi:MAG: hypothetical protein I3274_07720 [Candidatus Moeniiplasma glomeromycotorum]|nr:hypothetical protein [Candidatus Moeniiplasma glomeromycotorum]